MQRSNVNSQKEKRPPYLILFPVPKFDEQFFQAGDGGLGVGSACFEHGAGTAIEIGAQDVNQAGRGKSLFTFDQSYLGPKTIGDADELRGRPGVKAELVLHSDLA